MSTDTNIPTLTDETVPPRRPSYRGQHRTTAGERTQRLVWPAVAEVADAPLPQRASGAALAVETTRSLPWLSQLLGRALHALRRKGDL